MDSRSATSKKSNQAKSAPSAMPRRYWTQKEEEILVNLLEAIVADGGKIGGTFKGGYMNRLEKEMNEKLPGCGLQVKHIRSKLTVWKKAHFALQAILGSSGAAGFTMDPVMNVLIEDKQDAWIDYGKCNPNAVNLLKGKNFPWYVRWRYIFGTDIAAGEERVDTEEMRNGNGQNERVNQEGHMESGNPSNVNLTNTEGGEETDSSKGSSLEVTNGKGASSKKRKSISDDPAHIGMMFGEWMESTKSHLGEVSQKMMTGDQADQELPGDDSTKRARIYSAIAELGNLELEDIITATHHFANKKTDMDAFWGMPVEARGKFVDMILNGKLK